MGGATLLIGLFLPWLAGMAVLVAGLRSRRPFDAPGEIAWVAGAGYFVGAFLLTLWMRALSMVGIPFGIVSVGAPWAGLTVALVAIAWRRDREVLRRTVRAALHSLLFPPEMHGSTRLAWRLLLGWIALKFVLLGLEIAWQPLYPWDAWTQWATKARVWYELGRLAPFVKSDEWFAAGGAAYFDAWPDHMPTVPLLQVWACIALGRWDDALMNWPWWQMAVALACAVYGLLRGRGMSALAALVVAYFVASIPLLDVHVALAGYADLPLSAYYTCTALALLRWAETREWRDAAMIAVLAFACTQIKSPGLLWMFTLLPGIVVVLVPRGGLKITALGLGVTLSMLVVFAQTNFKLFGFAWHLRFQPAWSTLVDSYFLFGNWNLLWYGVPAAALLAGRQLIAPTLAPVTTLATAGAILLSFIFSFPDVGAIVAEGATQNRATLQFAPLAAVFAALAFDAFALRWTETAAALAVRRS